MVRPVWEGVGEVVNYKYIYILFESLTVFKGAEVALKALDQ
jgi:hypothetical protein